MKILINALSGNGDALMFSPSLRILKEKFPESRIDMLVMFKSVREMYSENPFINNIYFIDFLRQSKIKSLKEIRDLKNNNYDYSINVYPANRAEYNIVNAFLGAEKKIAHHYLHTNLLRAEYFNDILVDEVKDRHNVLQNLNLVKTLTEAKDEEAGKLEIFISGNERENAEEWIAKINPDKKMLIGFHPGSAVIKNQINKRWDKSKFAALGDLLIQKYNAAILLFGNEFELNEEIKSMMNGNAVIASTQNYMDSMARMTYCRLFVSNDTAFMHSAAALQIPVAAVFAYTNHKELYPWKTKHVLVRKELECSPCFYNSPKPADCKWKEEDKFKCIKMINVSEVDDAVNKLIINSENPTQL